MYHSTLWTGTSLNNILWQGDIMPVDVMKRGRRRRKRKHCAFNQMTWFRNWCSPPSGGIIKTSREERLDRNAMTGSQWDYHVVPYKVQHIYVNLCSGSLTILRWVLIAGYIPQICHFFTQAKFLESKIYTEKRVNYDKIHSKLQIFWRYYVKIHSKLPIFLR